SRKVTRAPVPRWAHPSGYFIEYAAAASRKRMNTWLSGMSPVATDVASACKADADGPLDVWVEVGGAGVDELEPAVGALVFEEPHPASSTDPPTAITAAP